MRSKTERTLLSSIDWTIIMCYFILVAVGIFNIYASIQMDDPTSLLVGRSGKQLMWFVISAVFATLILFVIKPRTWEVFSYPAYLTLLVLLVAVIFLSHDVKGSHSWFSFGPVSFQPAEISKITTSLFLAFVLSKPGFSFINRKDFLSAVGIVLLPMLIIVAENETGSALVYLGFIFALYREGLSGWFIIMGLLMILLFVLTLLTPQWVSLAFLGVFFAMVIFYYIRKFERDLRKRIKSIRLALAGLIIGVAFVFATDFVFEKVLADHQRNRIEILLGMKDDPMGYGYNVRQSMIAIGSGGVAGKGYLQGTQTAYGFVPEQSTDFIFCTVGEEWGFLGCLFVISVYALLIFCIIRDAEKSRETFTRIYGYCLSSCLFMHLFINIGMTIGLVPVIGIPLPYISYGGSSLLAFTVMLFIFVALDRQEKKYF